MKQRKHWGFVAGMGMASILVCALLIISEPFTNRAMAAGGEVDPLVATPDISIYASPPHSVTKIIADTPDPSTPGQWVSVSVTVTGGGATPTGTVTITGASSTCTIILSGGTGSCDVVFNTAGKKKLKAVYSGDGIYNPSSAKASHKVLKVTSATTITAAIPDPSLVGQPVVVFVTVNGTGIPIPTGKVVISGASTNCSILLAGGSGSCSVNFNSAGIKTLKAVYKGDVNYGSSSGTLSHTVNKGSTTTLITAESLDPSIPGQAVKVTVSVIGGAAKPTGTVDITGADINCRTTLSGGTGSCQVVFNTIGIKILTATYNGDKNYLSSTTSINHTVKNASKTTITADNPDSSLPGEAVVVDVTVSGPGVAPTGTVNITGADVNCSLTLAGGSGSCSVVFYTGGARMLTATYNGDANYVGSSGTTTHTVRRGNSLTAITAQAPDPSAPYQSVLVTVTVAPEAPGVVLPTGYVGVSTSGGPSVCTLTLVGGTGSCSVVFISSGNFTILAVYNGDGTYLTSFNTVTHTVQ